MFYYICGPLIHFAVLIGVATNGALYSLEDRVGGGAVSRTNPNALPLVLRTEMQFPYNASLSLSMTPLF